MKQNNETSAPGTQPKAPPAQPRAAAMAAAEARPSPGLRERLMRVYLAVGQDSWDPILVGR